MRLVFPFVFIFGCAPYFQEKSVQKQDTEVVSDVSFPRANLLEKTLDEIVSNSVPGVAAAVYSEKHGWWTGAAGYARIEDRTQMSETHLQFLQSVAKTYAAVVIMKLKEEGKLQLDEPMTKYLSPSMSKYITQADQITIRMLLNHTSGVPEYNSVPSYVSRLLQRPDYRFKPEDYLKAVKGKPLDFSPGSKYSYRNTNYVILALIADAITGDHAKYLREVIFKPLGLQQTFYRGDDGYLKYPLLVNAYWDRHSDGAIENVTGLQINNVMRLIGDDGIVSTPREAILFLRGLMEGKLLTNESLKEMMTWTKGRNGDPAYGYGIDYATFGGAAAYGHSGGGIGAGCQLYFFPEKNVYFFIAVNLGTVTESPIHSKIETLLNEFHSLLLQ